MKHFCWVIFPTLCQEKAESARRYQERGVRAHWEKTAHQHFSLFFFFFSSLEISRIKTIPYASTLGEGSASIFNFFFCNFLEMSWIFTYKRDVQRYLRHPDTFTFQFFKDFSIVKGHLWFAAPSQLSEIS